MEKGRLKSQNIGPDHFIIHMVFDLLTSLYTNNTPKNTFPNKHIYPLLFLTKRIIIEDEWDDFQ
jgi:hypothetical protein